MYGVPHSIMQTTYLSLPAVRQAVLLFQSSWSSLLRSSGYSEASSWGRSTVCGRLIHITINYGTHGRRSERPEIPLLVAYAPNPDPLRQLTLHKINIVQEFITEAITPWWTCPWKLTSFIPADHAGIIYNCAWLQANLRSITFYTLTKVTHYHIVINSIHIWLHGIIATIICTILKAGVYNKGWGRVSYSTIYSTE